MDISKMLKSQYKYPLLAQHLYRLSLPFSLSSSSAQRVHPQSLSKGQQTSHHVDPRCSHLASVAAAQKAGRLTPENHPRLSWQSCTSGGCSNVNGEVTIDANWRWFHDGQSILLPILPINLLKKHI
jgi:Glycosyl hydrolase family 7